MVNDMLTALDKTELTPSAIKLRHRSYELLRLTSASKVADVGCGSGRATSELAGQARKVTGVDPDPQLLEVAHDRYPEVTFVRATAESLPFDDAELDAYRADKVLHVLKNPADAITEASRVIKPTGRIVLIGQDWDTIAVAANDRALTRDLIRGFADTIPSPSAAANFRALLADAGFADIELEVSPMLFTDGEVIGPLLRRAAQNNDDWLAEQHERARTGRMTVCATIYLAAATRR
ncbi:methyltransferase domain-containing protein [Fodinicola feengrottensis]|uniref:Methyltransferase domain-containing protein n=1 Tax=Fodinicola feengrottensis TaxID=435914 RepID=A0ABN2HXS4_9ACTN|nr:methyltransferase domain-containing protein [Fodinicola feengrottensis]